MSATRRAGKARQQRLGGGLMAMGVDRSRLSTRLLHLILALIALTVLTGVSPVLAQDGPALRGVIVDEASQPVPDVTITVSGADDFSSATQTGADGSWYVAVSQPGSYTVDLDVQTLPESVSLRDPDRASLTVNVLTGPRTVQFPMGAASQDSGSALLGRTLQLVLDGLVFGLIIALAAVGLSMVFGTTGLTNFAHGEQMTLGALAAYGLSRTVGLPFVGSAVLALLICAAFGWFQDAFLWRPLRRRGTTLIAMLVVSIGFAILLRYTYLFFFGGLIKQLDYAGQAGLEIGSVTITPKSVIASAVAIAALTAVITWQRRSRMGKATRAVADNPALAASSGIDVERVIRVVWVISATLAGLGGIVFSLNNGVNWQQGSGLLLLVFAAVVVGGLGSPMGALLGALLVGVLIQVSTLIIPPELKELGALVVLIVLLLVRPQGLLGRAERVG